MTGINGINALELAADIRAKKLSVTEVVLKYIDAAEKSNLNTFLTVSKKQALEAAAKVQKQIDDGVVASPLAGVPVGIKDNISTLGIETTCASKALKGYVPIFNATVVDRLEQAGMVVIGKLNLDEFAMGGSSETGFFGPVRNPWDIERVAGGSSGGSAAAVAGGEVPLALGTDSGGSIRQPSAFCGITGFKPTYGAVSRFGAVAYASSMDQIGPMCRDINDCAAMLQIISGPDPKDPTCVIQSLINGDKSQAACETFPKTPNGFKIGIPRNFLSDSIDEDVKTAVLAAASEFESAGATLEEFEMPMMEHMVPTYYILSCAEASSNMSRFDGLKFGYRAEADTLSDVYRMSRSEGFGLEVKRRIMFGSFVLSSDFYDAYYKKAMQARTLIKDAFDKLFAKYDMILAPVTPTTAYNIGENIDDPLKMYMAEIYTISANLAGIPAVSLPCGQDINGLPIGFQLMGEAFSDEKLIMAARIYQTRTKHHKNRPGGQSNVRKQSSAGGAI